ncbi:MAG: BamA/TamA family outer membrane protein, partial [Gemmatimonadota bacterium]
RFTLSDYAYYRAWADVSVYAPLADGVFAARLRPGWVQTIGRGLELDEDDPRPGGPEVVHPFKRFYAGGANTIRGFGQNLTGPLLLFLPRPDTLLALGCDESQIDSTTSVWNGCDAAALSPGAFEARPLGGTVSLVGNFELRFPLVGQRWLGALFVDWGGVWQDADEFQRSLERGLVRDLVWTPGLGIRYLSPIGPLRIDVGYNSIGPRLFPVVTEAPDESQVVQLQVPYRYDPFNDPSGLREFLNRLQVHFSLGQAF